ncbi:MAG TPA: hypothetical protein DD730_02215 [Desulfosporosinus sp.]|nr:hypothetical protein [Desulfosporosinus sp.]
MSLNLIIIYFGYGLTFFTMGLVILLQYKQFSRITLAKNMWLLGAFGITHGLAEWGVMFTSLKINLVLQVNTLFWDRLIEVIILYISFLFLFEFGVRIIASVIKKLQWLRYLPWILGGVWFINFVFFGFADVNIDYWLLTSEAWSRILICFPGALFASIGFLLQTEELDRLKVPQLKILLIRVSLSFLFYGLVAGLVVPNAPFFPFNWSPHLLSQYAPFAVPVVRSLAGGAMAYFSIRVMGTFYYEYRRLLEGAEKNETLSKERERISRDLHDGVIQSLYAIGLEVEEVSYLTSESPHQARKSLENVINRLNGVILDIRFFIQDLRLSHRFQGGLKQQLEAQLDHFSCVTQISGQLILDPSINELSLTSEQLDHLHHIIQEALINIAKHAEAKEAQIQVKIVSNFLEISVKDNGKGMELSTSLTPLTGIGLKSIQKRVQILGGECSWESAPGVGTRLNLKILLLDKYEESSKN